MTKSEQAQGLEAGLSVVVPVYNSAEILLNLVEKLAEVLPRLSERYELILVNDGSADKSWAQIAIACQSRDWIRGVELSRNYGQHNALLCGLRLARYNLCVTMDDDLQHPPEELPKLFEAMNDDIDVVYGTPHRERHGLWRGVASRVTKMALHSAIGADTARMASAFRLFRTGLRRTFADFRGPFVSIDVLLTWATTRFTAVSVRRDARFAGSSNYTLRSLIRHAANMATGFSTLPLTIASWVGFSMVLFGLLIFAWVVGRYLVLGYSVPGFPFLASIIALFSGTQLFALGIIGEYLARMHFRIMDRPTYSVRTDVRLGHGDSDSEDA